MTDEGRPELTAVREVHRFDEQAFARYLSAHVEGYSGDLEIEQFEGGQSNPTFRLTAGGKRYVMRKKPPGELLPSAHAVEREYRVMDALRESGVPVPRMYHLCEDPSIIGTPFVVMEMVEGRVLVEPPLPSFSRDHRVALYEHFAQVLANLHAVDYQAVGLGDFGRPGQYIARQTSRWSKQYRASQTETIDEMEALMAWVPANIPEADETSLVHGDYRLGNCIIHATEPRIVAVLDWELSTLGHPLADLAYFCQCYHAGVTPGETLEGVDLDAAGIPSESAFVDRYCELAGRPPIDDWTFYMVFVMFRSAAIVQGVYKRGLDGNAASERSGEFAGFARDRAKAAWSLVQQNMS